MRWICLVSARLKPYGSRILPSPAGGSAQNLHRRRWAEATAGGPRGSASPTRVSRRLFARKAAALAGGAALGVLLLLALADNVAGEPARWPSRKAVLEEFARLHRGVRYRFGECTNRAMDCSCFIQRLFARRFRLQLPRTTLSQVHVLSSHRVGTILEPSHLDDRALCVGDLIYTYQNRTWWHGGRHVAVYLGAGRVLHSSAGLGGVGTSQLASLQRYHLFGVYRPLGCEPQGRSRVSTLPNERMPTWPSREEGFPRSGTSGRATPGR